MYINSLTVHFHNAVVSFITEVTTVLDKGSLNKPHTKATNIKKLETQNISKTRSDNQQKKTSNQKPNATKLTTENILPFTWKLNIEKRL